MKLLIYVLIFISQISVPATSVVPRKETQALLSPILSLRADAESLEGEEKQSALEKSEKLIARLFKMKTRASDEALVVLMNFYVGESLQPDLVHEVTVRGKRMLPLLLKYSTASVSFSEREYPSSMLLADDVRKKNFQDAIEAMRSGRVVGED
jgi:hypothetical protein